MLPAISYNHPAHPRNVCQVQDQHSFVVDFDAVEGDGAGDFYAVVRQKGLAWIIREWASERGRTGKALGETLSVGRMPIFELCLA